LLPPLPEVQQHQALPVMLLTAGRRGIPDAATTATRVAFAAMLLLLLPPWMHRCCSVAINCCCL